MTAKCLLASIRKRQKKVDFKDTTKKFVLVKTDLIFGKTSPHAFS